MKIKTLSVTFLLGEHGHRPYTICPKPEGLGIREGRAEKKYKVYSMAMGTNFY